MKEVTPIVNLKTMGVYAFVESRPGHRFFGKFRYVGQSKNMFKRFMAHKYCAKNGKPNSNLHLSRIINGHVRQGVKLNWKPLVICEEKDLDYYEIECIKLYKDTLVNFSEGGKRADAVKGGYSVVKRGIDPNIIEHQKMASSAAVSSGACRKNFQLAATNNTKLALARYEQSLTEAGFNKDYKPTFTEAKQYKLKYYFGKICEKHSSSLGKRVFPSGSCVDCKNEKRFINLKEVMK